MTSTLLGLHAQILAYPHDDVYRHQFADAADDAAGEPTPRSAYIRRALANPERSDPCLCFARGGKGPCDSCALLGEEIACIPRPKYGGTHYALNRGFVAEVRLTLVDFSGGKCRRCRGAGVAASHERRGRCPHCGGAGRTPGHAAEMFRRHPITRVDLIDREPVQQGRDFGWTNGPGSYFPAGSDLPDDLYLEIGRAAPSGAPVDARAILDRTGRRAVGFPTPEGAEAALSAACVALGRRLAGLRPLA